MSETLLVGGVLDVVGWWWRDVCVVPFAPALITSLMAMAITIDHYVRGSILNFTYEL
jgi:hypothetical protein